MSIDLSKVCRICLSEGARNIFDHANMEGGVKVSSLDNLVEKMRYVSMIQVKETDNLPKMICDVCIVHLNVSYTFKRQSVENDLKLRQYIIEKGLTIETIPPTSIFYSSNIALFQNTNRALVPFPKPIAIKTEPVEIETEIINSDDDMTNDVIADDESTIGAPSIITTNNGILTPSNFPSISSNNENTRSLTNSGKLMVVVNDNTLLSNSIPRSTISKQRTNDSRDLEFIKNYFSKDDQKKGGSHTSPSSTITTNTMSSLSTDINSNKKIPEQYKLRERETEKKPNQTKSLRKRINEVTYLKKKSTNNENLQNSKLRSSVSDKYKNLRNNSLSTKTKQPTINLKKTVTSAKTVEKVIYAKKNTSTQLKPKITDKLKLQQSKEKLKRLKALEKLKVEKLKEKLKKKQLQLKNKKKTEKLKKQKS